MRHWKWCDRFLCSLLRLQPWHVVPHHITLYAAAPMNFSSSRHSIHGNLTVASNLHSFRRSFAFGHLSLGFVLISIPSSTVRHALAPPFRSFVWHALVLLFILSSGSLLCCFFVWRRWHLALWFDVPSTTPLLPLRRVRWLGEYLAGWLLLAQ
jgi:hypothetical protein